MAVQAKVIADSRSPNGDRITTMEIELHRFVLAEFNTHRMFSRNFQSSRAVPVKKLLEQVKTNPAMPVHWGTNQAGMQAKGELGFPNKGHCEMNWRAAAREMVSRVESMQAAGLHKQVANRLLEPFMWTKGVVTGSKAAYDNFFSLRCHEAAQPEIQALAYLMRDVYDDSCPKLLEYGQWHLPYVNSCKDFGGDTFYTTSDEEIIEYDEVLSTEDAIKVSASCCAQVSYRTLDDSLDKAKRIYDLLNLPEDGQWKDSPPHFSPTEHVSMCANREIYLGVCRGDDVLWEYNYSGNLDVPSFVQYRKAIEYGYDWDLIEL